MKRTFTFEFEEEDTNTLTYECSFNEDEQLSTKLEDGMLTICANQSGFMTLAKIVAKMALGSHKNGFHLHIQENFHEDLPDCLTLLLLDTNPIHGAPGSSRS